MLEAVLKSGLPSYGKYWKLKFHFRDFKSHGSLDFLADGLKKLKTFVQSIKTLWVGTPAGL